MIGGEKTKLSIETRDWRLREKEQNQFMVKWIKTRYFILFDIYEKSFLLISNIIRVG